MECVFIYPSIFYTRLIRQSGRGEPIPAVIGREAGYTLDRSPVHHRDKRDKQPHTLTLTPKDNFRHQLT